jgi:Na+-transporting methylmalonyl-CoA/oxaloacetate decarboxylase gamma subunit
MSSRAGTPISMIDRWYRLPRQHRHRFAEAKKVHPVTDESSAQQRNGDADSATPPRPWILTLGYWNEVAKDVVKNSILVLVLYLVGSLSGIFKLRAEILWIAGIFLAYLAYLALVQWFMSRVVDSAAPESAWPTNIGCTLAIVQWLALPVLAVALHRLVRHAAPDPEAWVATGTLILIIYGLAAFVGLSIWRSSRSRHRRQRLHTDGAQSAAEPAPRSGTRQRRRHLK